MTTQQQVGKLKLSQAIRIGLSQNREYREAFFDYGGGYCAICLAIKALGGEPVRIFVGRDPHYSLYNWLSAETGAPVNVVRDISDKHFVGLPATECADYAESLGY